MNTNTNRIKQWQEQEALSRFQLIAPLLQEDLDDAKRLQLRKQIAQDNDISVRPSTAMKRPTVKDSLPA